MTIKKWLMPVVFVSLVAPCRGLDFTGDYTVAAPEGSIDAKMTGGLVGGLVCGSVMRICLELFHNFCKSSFGVSKDEEAEEEGGKGASAIPWGTVFDGGATLAAVAGVFVGKYVGSYLDTYGIRTTVLKKYKSALTEVFTIANSPLITLPVEDFQSPIAVMANFSDRNVEEAIDNSVKKLTDASAVISGLIENVKGKDEKWYLEFKAKSESLLDGIKILVVDLGMKKEALKKPSRC